MVLLDSFWNNLQNKYVTLSALEQIQTYQNISLSIWKQNHVKPANGGANPEAIVVPTLVGITCPWSNASSMVGAKENMPMLNQINNVTEHVHTLLNCLPVEIIFQIWI